jgi:mannitol-1-/sugar-/sorbitol-6-phosphatase
VQERIRCAALIFDMDGTLVDSAGPVERGWTWWAARHGLSLSAVLAFSHGRPSIETMKHFLPGVDCSRDAAELAALEEADTSDVVAVPGASDSVVAAQNGAWAVVTSANRRLAETRLTVAGLPLPPVLVSAEDIERGKPNPEGFLKAAMRMNVAPSDCLVFEDTAAGVAAALSAGMRAVGLLTTVPGAQLGCDFVIEDFRQVRVKHNGHGFEVVLMACER